MIVQCAKPRSPRRREKTDAINPSYLAWRLKAGCPLCGAELKSQSRGNGDIFYTCPNDCRGDDGEYYYVGIHGEKRYTL